MKTLFLVLIAFSFTTTLAQNNSYIDSAKQFIDNYVKTHGVVKDNDKKYLQFYPINEKYLVSCRFERTEDSRWFMMESSGPVKKSHRVYGKIHFKLNDTAVSLCIYQSQDLMKIEQYKDYLFLPFMDATTGEDTYESGRYIDLSIDDIISNEIVIDFNKAYNPYCAYISEGYNCPVPPKENRINVAIKAGEKKYLKAVH